MIPDTCIWCGAPTQQAMGCEHCNSTWARCSKCGDTGLCSDDSGIIVACPFCEKGREQAELEQLMAVKGY